MKITMQRIGLPIAAIAAGLALTGCADESPWGTATDEKGKISLTLTADSDIATTQPSVGKGTRATGDLADYGVNVPSADDFAIRLEKKDGSYAKTWATLRDFREEASENGFSTGAYTMTASYGKKGEQGFDKPYFEASSTFTVLSDQTSEVTMTAGMQNALVAVTYTDNLKKYLQNYSARVHTEGIAQDVVFTEAETRPGFVEAGDALLSITYSKRGSGQSTTLEIGKFASVAKTLYNITMDVTEPNGGDATLKVEFTDAIDEMHTIEIPMTDNVAAAPEITCVGFENGSTVEMLESTSSLQDIKMNVKARGLIGKAMLTVQSDNGSRPSWGSEIDLCTANENEQNQIAAAGIDAKGFFKNPDIYGIIDLTGFGKSMSKGRYTVSLSVTDKNGKMSEPATVVIDCQQIELSNESATSVFGTGRATLTMNYNGQNPLTDVSFKVLNDKGNMVEARVTSAEEITGTRGFETKQYLYELEIPTNPKKEIDAEVYHCGAIKGTFKIQATAPAYQITQVDAFSRYAYLKISNASGNAAELATIIRYIRVKSGNSDLDITSRDESEGILTIGALTPGSTYALETSILAGEWNTGSTIATESELAVPNGDFENLTETISTSINQGGRWTITAGGTKYQTTLSIYINEPTGWVSSNSTTCNINASNKNSWYVIPSVYNTSLIWESNQPTAKFMGIGQDAYKSTADIYKGLTAKSGSNAMVIRNVAWDNNGTQIADLSQTGNSNHSNYYCSNKPSSIANRTAGYLKLGSASSDGASFSSRPSALKGWFKYQTDDQDTNEKGFVTINILNGTDVIGSGSAELSSQSEYTEFNIPITYTTKTFGKKATSLQIAIYSSNKTSDIKTTDYCNKEECCSRGASLTVDNLTFEYK